MNALYLSSDTDEWLYSVLSVDPLLQEYCPGGFWPNDPDQVVNQAWSPNTTYLQLDSVTGPDGIAYRSRVNANLNNDPTTSPAQWALAFPCVRWWMQSPGRDVKRQDGQAGRVESQPCYVVTVLDKQRAGVADKIQGSNGQYSKGVARLVTLLDNRQASFTTADGRTLSFYASQISAYEMIEPSNGDNLVMCGHWYQLRVQ